MYYLIRLLLGYNTLTTRIGVIRLTTELSLRPLPPFRYDVVGSYLRPESLKQARADFASGKIDQQGLTQLEDKAIADLVQQQKEAGLQVITDGEFRRSWWHLDFMWELNGVEKVAIEKGYEFNGEVTRAESARLTGKITGENHAFVDHFVFLQQFAEAGITPRQTIPAPAQFLKELQRPDNQSATTAFYPNEEDLIADIAAAYQQVFRELYDRGCRNIQLDDCTWGMMVDPTYSSNGLQADAHQCTCGKHVTPIRNEAIDLMAEQCLAVNNAALLDLPKDLIMTTHVCRGNYHSTWASSGGYEPIADVLFARENVSAYYLEFDTERSGDFSPLAHVSNDKFVVLGLVSSKVGELEEAADVIQRIQEATKYVPLERLCLSTQCGFASTEEGNILTEAQQWAKIAFVKDVAKEVWG